ncbi:MAG: hypothetical protein ACRCW6_03415, partial [Mycoplasmoidaceae bacterium]
VKQSLEYAFKLLDKEFNFGLDKKWELDLELDIPDVDKILFSTNNETTSSTKNPATPNQNQEI